MSAVGAMFGRIKTGAPVLAGGLTLVPLLAPDAAGVDAELLEEALAKGSTVTEIGEAGSVNSVRVTHQGSGLLLLLDGEEIIGAKQNRVFNASFLVSPGQTALVPVSCVEQGRWKYEARAFSSASRTLNSAARSEKLKRVSGSLKKTGSYDANQGAVWQDVAGYLGKTQVRSGTMAYADGWKTRAAAVEVDVSTLAPAPTQIGLAAVRADKLVSMDVFGSPALYARAFKKIARGMLAEVYDVVAPSLQPHTVVEAALAALAKIGPTAQPAPGCGTTLHGDVPGYVLGGIAHEGTLYHCLVAPA